MALRRPPSPPRRLALAAALALAPTWGHAQTETQVVTVTGRSSAANTAGVAGFGDVPLARLPLSASVISAAQLADAGIASLGDITRLDAGVTDAYNAPGYWGQVAARGFTLDNRFNYRRDGLPINAETMLPTGNKAALELMKGLSGIQAGTSSPGGLLNLVVKRPTAQALRHATLEFTEPGTVTAGIDVGDRAGPDGALGWRLNASATRYDPMTRASRGHAHLLAGAASWQVSRDGLLEAEFEHSRQSQPSTPGFSLLGNVLPPARDIEPRLNLNNQPWSLPVVMTGDTGSLRYTHAFSEDWRVVAHLLQQRLKSEDRIAFPYGCSAEDTYDRYCSDGRFDLYDYRSEGERRTTTAADLGLQGRARLAGMTHELRLGVQATRFAARFNRQAYNWVGMGHVDGTVVLPSDPSLVYDNTQRTERGTELYLTDNVALNAQWQLWAGLRHSQLRRSAVTTSQTEATAYRQSITTPWLALSWQLRPQHMAYVSWGQGVESTVAPNRPEYLNAGVALPALKSRQLEAGWKHRSEPWQWQVAAFDIDQPVWRDAPATGRAEDACSEDDTCVRRVADGSARHRGLEATVEWQAGPWSLRASAMALRARREDSADGALNGLRPTNVPERSLKAQGVYNVAAVPGLALMAFATHEGERMVLPDNRIATPGWTRVDLGLRYAQPLGGARLVWRLGVDNVADRRAWKEAPYQFGHAYLYPLAPRTWHASVQASL